jgi:tetratricopeptide (TPR) repeat protein
MVRSGLRPRQKVDYATLHHSGAGDPDTCTTDSKKTQSKMGRARKRPSSQQTKEGKPSGPTKNARVEDPMTVSVGHRIRGNGFYSLANKPGLSIVSKEENLQKALNAYYRAMQTSEGQGEISSAAKNYASAAWKMGLHKYELDKAYQQVEYFYKEALKHFLIAETSGLSKSQQWREDIASRLRSCLEEAMTHIQYLYEDAIERSSAIERLSISLGDSHWKAYCYVRIGMALFHCSISAVAKEDFKKSLTLLRDCYYPIQEARRLGQGRQDIQTEVAILEEDVFLQQCVAESLQARSTGDALLTQVLSTEEELNIDLVWEVIDWYKRAILLTKEKEVEFEAIACSRLGHVYANVLKLKTRAKDYYMRCIQLAGSLHPRTFNDQDWYKECAAALEKYQKETLEEEESRHQKEREKYMKELKADITKLDEMADGDRETFLKFVYSTYPPKNTRHKIKKPKTGDLYLHDELKKAFQQGVVHYHPDKQDVEKHGMTWKVLCEEITKRLTCIYECYK